jgi:hypothetical protein
VKTISPQGPSNIYEVITPTYFIQKIYRMASLHIFKLQFSLFAGFCLMLNITLFHMLIVNCLNPNNRSIWFVVNHTVDRIVISLAYLTLHFAFIRQSSAWMKSRTH